MEDGGRRTLFLYQNWYVVLPCTPVLLRRIYMQNMFQEYSTEYEYPM